MAVSKKRVIKSLETLSEELKDLIREQYPSGYESSINRITNAKKEPIFVFPLETEDAIYLIKVPATKNSDGEYDVEANPETEFGEDGAPAVPRAAAADDDDFGGGDDDSFAAGGGDEDDDEFSGKSREASYDPDFDN